MSDLQRPWYLRAFTALCAWFTSLFLLAWISIPMMNSSEGTIILGIVLLAGSSLAGRSAKDSDFLEHASLACSMAGRGALVASVGLKTNSIDGFFGLMALAEGLWFLLNPNFLFRCISALSAYGFLAAFFGKNGVGAEIWFPSLLAGMLTLWVFVLSRERAGKAYQEVWRPLGWASVLTLALWPLLAGDCLMFGRDRETAPITSFLLVALLCGLAAWLLRSRILERVIIIPVLAGLAWALSADPSVMAGLILGLVGFQCRQMKVTTLGGATLLAGIIGYYYKTNDTLLYKSGMLAVSGVFFALAAAWLAGALQKERREGRTQASLGRGGWRVLAVLALFLSVSIYLDLAAQRAEARKGTGQLVYVELRPRDPRDPLMGDYMAVNFKLCDAILSARFGKAGVGSNGSAWVRQDEKKILSFDSLDEGQGAKEGLSRVAYQEVGGRITLGTTKVYFQEGDQAKFQRAKYGRFQLQDSGTLTWIGFAGENLEDLK